MCVLRSASLALLAVVGWAACETSEVRPVAPAYRAPISTGQADEDGDGIIGADDLCPADAEDRDGFEDADGCPDPDNDQDRIADTADACPNDPETYNGYEDTDGCPDESRVVVTDIECPLILDKIYFRHRSAAIQVRSKPIIDAIAATLIGNPQLERLVIVGATARNERDGMTLSLARAEAVRDELVRRGVALERLDVAAAGTRLDLGGGNDRNRRVELYITRAEGEAVDVPALRQIAGP